MPINSAWLADNFPDDPAPDVLHRIDTAARRDNKRRFIRQ